MRQILFEDSDIEQAAREAVAHYWRVLAEDPEAADDNRQAVVSGKQMDGFCALIKRVLESAGVPDASIYVSKKLEVPGYFRPTKKWDLIVVHESKLVAALEFKSQVGPSFGNNRNNRTEEAVGSATDLWVAHKAGAFGHSAAPPWLGWLMMVEEAEKSMKPGRVAEPHFDVDPVFRNTSLINRYEILCRRLVTEKLYNASALLISPRSGAIGGEFREPAKDLSLRTFLTSLAGHIGVHLASR